MMNEPTGTMPGSGDANDSTCFRRTPVSRVVSLFCLLAALPMTHAAHANNTLVMTAQRQVFDWAGQSATSAGGESGIAETTAQSPHTADAGAEKRPVDTAGQTEATHLADAAKADEQIRLSRVATEAEQAHLAETAKADEKRRLAAAPTAGKAQPANAEKATQPEQTIGAAHPVAITAEAGKPRVEAVAAADASRRPETVQPVASSPKASLLAFTPVAAQAAVPAAPSAPVVNSIVGSAVSTTPVASAPVGSSLPVVADSSSRTSPPAQRSQQEALEMPPDMTKDDQSASRASGVPPLPSSVPRLPRIEGLTRASAVLASLPAPVAPLDLPPLPGELASHNTHTVSDKATDVLARWMEEQPDAVDEGTQPSAAELRRILAAAAQAAVDRSPQVRQADAEYQAAKADVNEAKGQRWPQVDIGSQSKGLQFGPGYRQDDNVGNAINVNITTSVFDWGRIRKTIGSREQSATAAQQQYQVEMEDTAYEVINTLVELGKQRVITDVSQQYVDRMTTLVRMLSEIVSIDAGRGSELTQARGRLLQAQAARDAAEAKVRDGELNLRKLVGEDAVPIPRTRAWQVPLANEEEMLSEVGEHPSIEQARAEANAADLNEEVVKASARPQLNWVVSANTGRDVLGRREAWQTMLTLNWAAFRGGSASAAYQAANQRAAASWQRIEQQQRDLAYAVRAADQDAHTFLERADLYRNLSAETDRVRKAFFQQWYHLGRRTLLDVLIAESDYYGNRVSEITTRFDGYQAVFREYASAGALVRWLHED